MLKKLSFREYENFPHTVYIICFIAESREIFVERLLISKITANKYQKNNSNTNVM